jgi:hypothetical protein
MISKSQVSLVTISIGWRRDSKFKKWYKNGYELRVVLD